MDKKKGTPKKKTNKNNRRWIGVREQAKRDFNEMYTNNRMSLFFWTFVIVFAILFFIFKLGLLDGVVQPPSEFNTLDRLITAFITIAFVKLGLAILHPIYTTHAAKKVFGSYAAAKQSWRFISYLVWIGTIVGVVAYLFGFENLALSLGLASAAFVYVMQTPIINAMGWMYIAYSKIYRIGDRIQMDEIRGDIVDITIMHTNIREISGWLGGDIHTGRVISIPNKRVLEGDIRNYTAQSNYIWDSVNVSITYESDHLKAKRIIEEEIERVVGEDMKKLPREIKKMADFPELAGRFITRPTVFMKLADSSVTMEGIYAAPSDRRFQIHSEITENILRRISETDGVSVAYPHMHIVQDEDKEK